MEYIDFIGLLITVILILLGLILKKSKILFFIQIIWMWILQALNSGGVDFSINKDIFDVSIYKQWNWLNGGLYNLICYYFKINNYSYIFMNSILVSIGLFLIIITVRKYTKNICFVMSLLYIYPFADNIIQKRFFLAAAIIIFAIPYLFKNDRKSTFIYIILCIIAGQFHVSAYIYILFLAVKKVSYKTLKKVIPIIIIFSFIIKPIIPKIAILIFPASKVNLYFYIFKTSLSGALFWMLFQIGFIVLIYMIKDKNENNEYLNNLKKISLFSLVFLPLLFYEPTFIRIYRTILIFNYIAFAQIQKSYINNYRIVINKNIFLLTSCQLIYMVFAFIMVYGITGQGLSNMIIPIFENNLFLKLFM